MRYFQKHPVVHMPVDLDGNQFIDTHLKNEIVEMFNVFDHNSEYKEISMQHEILTMRVGFPYLNSNKYTELFEQLHIVEEAILINMNNEKLFQTYKSWVDINHKRENEMIKNIYNYSALNRYNRALFLVGAEHRKAIMDKIQRLEKNNKLQLNWIFNYLD